MAVPVVCPDEDSILTPTHSAELMTTEAISFVETDTNAPAKTYDIETLGPEMENIEVAPPVVSPAEEQTLSPGEKSDKQTTIINTDKTVPLRKKKSRFLSALRRGLRRIFRTICGCDCVTSSIHQDKDCVTSSNHRDEKDYRDEIEKFNDRWSV